MNMKHAFQTVLDSGLENYHKPRYWEICGVKVQFKPVPGGVGQRKWKRTLDEWLPRYDEVGWLDGLHKIIIGPEAAHSKARRGVGRYDHDGSIYLNNDISLGAKSCRVYQNTRDALLTHEVVHHAHLTINGYENSNKSPEKEDMLKETVSWYAGKNVGESIAEIGTGIVHGADFPERVHEYYSDKDGPMGAYDIA